MEGGFASIQGPTPVAFKALPEYRAARHMEARRMFQEDEKRYG
jgi:hypothetical protein